MIKVTIVASCSCKHTKIHDYSQLNNVIIFLVKTFDSHKRHVLYDYTIKVNAYSQNVVVMDFTF
jgi:hypothetical protein